MPGPMPPLPPYDRFYAGAVEVLPPRAASLALVAYVRAALLAAFDGEDPVRVRDRLDNDAWFTRFAAVRRGIPQDPHAIALAGALLRDLGCGRVVHDRPRVRGVTSDGHTIPMAAPAYALHRDTWYANPRAQVNLWIPVWDAPVAHAFAILPEWFDRPVPNTSGGFDQAVWAASGGFQAYATPTPPAQVHPSPSVPVDRARALRLAVPAGGILAFAGAHLHGTEPQSTGRARYSIELRFVDLDDVDAGRGAPSVDDASRGSTLGDYLAL